MELPYYLCPKDEDMNEVILPVQNLIYEIRGKRVMLDFDLAKLYQVETKVLNQAVKRNIKRFPPDFMFQLSPEEVVSMRSQFVTAPSRNVSAPPFAFTEQGVAMLSGLLHSDVAIDANIAIMRAFVCVREYLSEASSLSTEIQALKARVDLLQLQQEDNMEAINDLSEDVRQDIDSLCIAIGELAAKIEEKKNQPRTQIGFK